jgi:hypothetical protein
MPLPYTTYRLVRVAGMFYAEASSSQKLFSLLTQFSNGRKRNLRPIHSLDEGERDRPRDC